MNRDRERDQITEEKIPSYSQRVGERGGRERERGRKQGGGGRGGEKGKEGGREEGGELGEREREMGRETHLDKERHSRECFFTQLWVWNFSEEKTDGRSHLGGKGTTWDMFKHENYRPIA